MQSYVPKPLRARPREVRMGGDREKSHCFAVPLESWLLLETSWMSEIRRVVYYFPFCLLVKITKSGQSASYKPGTPWHSSGLHWSSMLMLCCSLDYDIENSWWVPKSGRSASLSGGERLPRELSSSPRSIKLQSWSFGNRVHQTTCKTRKSERL